MKKILLTGGCGFIGTNLISLLNQEDGAEITVLDNESVGKREYLDDFAVARFIKGDILNEAAVDEAVRGKDAIVHLAGQTGVIPSIEDPRTDAEVNIFGTLNLLEACRRHGVGRFITASSAAPVGACKPPMHEDLPACPTSPYGASKLGMEGYCSAYFHSFGVPTVVLRFSNCYGAGSRNKSSAVALFMKQILAGETLAVYGDGEQTRDFVYVRDLCRAITLALGAEGEGEASPFGKVYQAAAGVETTVNDLIGRLRALAEPGGYPVTVEYKPARAGEVIRNYAKIDRIREAFGYDPETSLDEGLRITWDYFRNEFEAGN